MSSLGKAILDVADDLVGWAGSHPTLVLLLMLAFVVAADQARLLAPMDWWGEGWEGR